MNYLYINYLINPKNTEDKQKQVFKNLNINVECIFGTFLKKSV